MALSDSICWDRRSLQKCEWEERQCHRERIGELTESLLIREAIPRCRLAYFTDPALNVGGHGKSRKQVFERTGPSGADMFRDGNFMPYLRYFIDGPELPKPVIDGFCKVVEEDWGTSGMVLDQVMGYVRRQVRQERLGSDAHEEFFKLAHEINRSDLAEPVRKAALSARS